MSEVTIAPKNNVKKDFGGGYRKSITDKMGLKWCNCTNPRLTTAMGRGLAYCLKCGTPYYH